MSGGERREGEGGREWRGGGCAAWHRPYERRLLGCKEWALLAAYMGDPRAPRVPFVSLFFFFCQVASAHRPCRATTPHRHARVARLPPIGRPRRLGACFVFSHRPDRGWQHRLGPSLYGHGSSPGSPLSSHVARSVAGTRPRSWRRRASPRRTCPPPRWVASLSAAAWWAPTQACLRLPALALSMCHRPEAAAAGPARRDRLQRTRLPRSSSGEGPHALPPVRAALVAGAAAAAAADTVAPWATRAGRPPARMESGRHS